MNEFPDPSQQPTDNPLRRLRSSDTPPIPERLEPARPGRRPAGPQPVGHQPARPAGQLEPSRSPVWVRVVWNAWPGEIGVGVWNADRKLFTVVEELLDPRLLAADLVRAAVQGAALHFGIVQPVAGLMGQAAKDWFPSLSKPGRDAHEVQAVQAGVDLALSAENGSLTNSPELRKPAVDETVNIVKRLLGPGAPPPGGLESFFRTFMSAQSSVRPSRGPSPFGGGFSPM